MLHKLAREIRNICNASEYILIWTTVFLVSNNERRGDEDCRKVKEKLWL